MNWKKPALLLVYITERLTGSRLAPNSSLNSSYKQLNQLAEHTGIIKAKLLKALIKKTVNLLQNKQ
ncbi:hypothetical protein H6G91_39430 [Nostoc muscorum FACHB-395]|nr:hypothetical protein [Desmonostoc muscorum FACHB-395]